MNSNMSQLFQDEPKERLKDEEQQPFLFLDHQIQTKNDIWTSKVPQSVFPAYKIIFVGLFVASIAGNVLLYLKAFGKSSRDHTCSRHTEQYPSPVLNVVDVSYNSVRFNGSLFSDSVYRQFGNATALKEADKAWEALGVGYQPIPIPPEQAERYGLKKSHIKFSEQNGGGILGSVEALHHLHCLNLLRKSTHWNWNHYMGGPKKLISDPEYMTIAHANHCLDILRQQIMCTADTSLLGLFWIKPYGPAPFPDFNTDHKCKNFEAIRQYAEENQAPKKWKPKVYPDDLLLDSIPRNRK